MTRSIRVAVGSVKHPGDLSSETNTFAGVLQQEHLAVVRTCIRQIALASCSLEHQALSSVGCLATAEEPVHVLAFSIPEPRSTF